MLFSLNGGLGLCCALGVSVAVVPASQAEVVFDWAVVGNAGNTADPTTGYGAVAYEYRMSRHEVTNTQFVAFLNAVDPSGGNSLNLYKTEMASGAGGITFDSGAGSGSKYAVRSGQGNRPVVYVSWDDAARFTNWLHNGQGSGSTETGVYNLADGSSASRGVDAQYFLPSQDEWYKAVYHDASAGLAGTYFIYGGTSSNDQPTSALPSVDPSAVNYNYNDGIDNGINSGYVVSGSSTRPENPLTDVGAYTEAQSPYGLFDASGNVFEWTDTSNSADTRNLRGGSWLATAGFLRGENSNNFEQDVTTNYLGFRVASAVPEPSGAAVLVLSGALCMVRRRR